MKDIALVWDLNGVLFKNLVIDLNTLNIVEQLNAKGLSQYICTNTLTWKLDEWREEYSLEKYFKKIFSINELGLLKNDPKVYEYIQKEIPEKNIYFIDDSLHNLKAAETIGIIGIQYISDKQIKKELKLLNIYNDN
ncbi:hypothetical protein CVU76_01015 [Candidatus Dojkabacteria bacterium HGW-Dojkabacteria-1]|uniref:HAD family hydrolase n=1 Tax=Candidatus Dojkabacteria bacterium HGW-Dojkabacteria-1 TaxID=2013761 RepID=A0A2N2F307_9BACT|nr:MAG: hypothetical protein CVU76_01015 [Candidatus Dojkabacteria bacterium HGW-Dojkabacteria-1]